MSNKKNKKKAQDVVLADEVLDSVEREKPSSGSAKSKLPSRRVRKTKSDSTALVPYDPLQRYLSEIRHLPILSRDEEHELALRFHTEGDTAAGYKLVLAN